MTGVRIELDLNDWGRLRELMSGLEQLDTAYIADIVAQEGEGQTRRRIENEKTAPDGTPWAPNLKGTSILFETGQHLLFSVAHSSTADEAIWGAGWEFAHIHQEGAVITPKTAKALHFKVGGKSVVSRSVTIPARPFVGISGENAVAIEDLVTDVLGHLTDRR